METSSEKIISLLEKILAACEGVRAQLAASQHTKRQEAVAAGAFRAYVLADSKVWKNGAGAFCFAKVDGERSTDQAFDVGIKAEQVSDIDGYPMKGDIIEITGNIVETQSTTTGKTFRKCFAQTFSYVSRAGTSQAKPQSSLAQAVAPAQAVEDMDEDVPF